MNLRYKPRKRNVTDLEALERSLEGEKLSVLQRIKRLERSKGMQIFMWITLAVLALYAVFAFLYTTVIIYASGTATSFLWFWPVTCGIALVAVVGLFLVLTGRLPRLKTAAMCLSILLWLGLTVFFAVEAVVFSAGRKEPNADAEYVIVLGAQVRGETPTLVLNARIKAAAEYLNEYPDAIAISSGGKGSGESISEAEAIKRGLMRLGIAEERILLEDRSTSTAENLTYSAEVIQRYEAAQNGMVREELDGEDVAGKILFVPKDVVLVTNDFHVYRGVRLAENLGYMQVSGLGATDFFAVTIQYYVREFFAIVAENVRGNF